jgi:hypothetical protein
MGFKGWFDTYGAFFDDIISGLSDTISSQAHNLPTHVIGQML